jgi:hypothetical protein
MALANLGPHLHFDQIGDTDLNERYLSVTVYCGLERTDMDLNRVAFDQLMKGSRFKALLHHMAVTNLLGMQWNYFKDDLFIDSNNVKFHVCSYCKHLAPFKCSCRTTYYCSGKCQRSHWFIHKLVCSRRK